MWKKSHNDYLFRPPRSNDCFTLVKRASKIMRWNVILNKIEMQLIQNENFVFISSLFCKFVVINIFRRFRHTYKLPWLTRSSNFTLNIHFNVSVVSCIYFDARKLNFSVARKESSMHEKVWFHSFILCLKYLHAGYAVYIIFVAG